MPSLLPLSGSILKIANCLFFLRLLSFWLPSLWGRHLSRDILNMYLFHLPILRGLAKEKVFNIFFFSLLAKDFLKELLCHNASFPFFPFHSFHFHTFFSFLSSRYIYHPQEKCICRGLFRLFRHGLFKPSPPFWKFPIFFKVIFILPHFFKEISTSPKTLNERRKKKEKVRLKFNHLRLCVLFFSTCSKLIHIFDWVLKKFVSFFPHVWWNNYSVESLTHAVGQARLLPDFKRLVTWRPPSQQQTQLEVWQFNSLAWSIFLYKLRPYNGQHAVAIFNWHTKWLLSCYGFFFYFWKETTHTR